MIFFIRVIAILLRILLYFSPMMKKLSKFFLFETLAYSSNILKENYLMRKISNFDNQIKNFENEENFRFNMVNSDSYFTVRKELRKINIF